MKKKLLKTFLLAAGLLVGGSAWGQEMDRTDGSGLTFFFSGYGSYTAGGSIEIGGGAAYYGNGINIYTNNRYVQCNLNTALQSGDVIYLYRTGNAKNSITIYDDKDKKTLWYTSGEIKNGEHTFTVTANEAGATSFCIFGNGGVLLQNVEVRREGASINLAGILSEEDTEVIYFDDVLTGTETYNANTVVNGKVTVSANSTQTAAVYTGDVVTSGKNSVNGIARTKALDFPTGTGFVVRLPAGIGRLTLYYDTNEKSGSANSKYQFDQYNNSGRSSTSMYPGTLEVVNNYATPRVFYMYVDNPSNRNVRLYGLKWEPEFTFSKTISAAGWATYCCAYPLDFTNDITNLTDAYIITGGANGYVTMTSVKGGTVPANTGLLLKGTEGTVNIPAVANSETDVTANKLVGVTSEKTLDLDSDDDDIADSHVYVLMNETTGEKRGLGFYKTTTTSFTLSANTAYLPDGFDVAGARSFFALSDDVTGINGVESANKEQNQVYNLNGQRVAQPSKGLYIINGKKVVMK